MHEVCGITHEVGHGMNLLGVPPLMKTAVLGKVHVRSIRVTLRQDIQAQNNQSLGLACGRNTGDSTRSKQLRNTEF